MRQIEFRGKDVHEWHYGPLSQSVGLTGQPEEGVYISNTAGAPYAFKVELESVGEFTGKIDSEQNKIFEGDIVEQSGGSIYKIKYNVDWACFELVPIIARYPITFYELDIIGECVTVRGNVYDSPDFVGENTCSP